MSYILEALKKAQAERQLGHAPDIHTAPLHAAAPAQQRSARTRVWIGAGAGAVIALAAAAWWFRSAGPLTTAVPVAHSAAPQPAPAAARPALVPAAAPAAPASSGTAPSGAITPAVAAAALPLAAAAPPAAPAAPAAAPTPAAAPAGQVADDALPTARELPDAIRQSLPPITLGGYIYATNPADRLVLIDKTLRHEGEEIAPGLTLERLQPRYAVLNFRGSRYRVPY